MGVFEDSGSTVRAIDGLLELGIPDEGITVMTGVPYPQRALGRRVEWLRLPYIVLIGALGGLTFGLFLAVITPHLYRLDVGGHPTVGLAPAAVIVFVFTMMATIITTFLGVLWEMNFPEFGLRHYDKSVTDGSLALFVDVPLIQQEQAKGILTDCGGHEVREAELVSV
jgi:hypothetical protein